MTNTPLKFTFFMLVKTTNQWLQKPIPERMEFVKSTFRPLLKEYSAVSMRYFDIEAFSTRCTDMIMWETSDVAAYQTIVEKLRETLFWDTYFDIVEILPGIEDAYATFYQVDPI